MSQIINVDSLDIGELSIYKNCNESQLLHYFEPNGGLFIAESPMVVKRALEAGYRPYSMLIDEALLRKTDRMYRDTMEAGGVSSDIDREGQPDIEQIISKCGDIPIYCADEALLGKLTGFKLTRGILCAMYRAKMPSVEDILSCCSERSAPKADNAVRIAVLDGIENPTNVGAIFRNAAALGIDAILLTSDCADPLYRRSLRVSMGTALIIPWTIIPADDEGNKKTDIADKTDNISKTGDINETEDINETISNKKTYNIGNTNKTDKTDTYIGMLHKAGFILAAMALRRDSLSPDAPELKEASKLAIVLGNEGSGLPEEVISGCDHTVMIPMLKGVDSLNVAAASAIAFWEMGCALDKKKI